MTGSPLMGTEHTSDQLDFVLLTRLAATLGFFAAVSHLMDLGTADSTAVGMAVMAAGCILCSIHLWRAPTNHMLAASAMMTGTMLSVHFLLGASHNSHAPLGVHSPMSVTVESMTSMPYPIVFGHLELAVIACAAFLRTREIPPEIRVREAHAVRSST